MILKIEKIISSYIMENISVKKRDICIICIYHWYSLLTCIQLKFSKRIGLILIIFPILFTTFILECQTFNCWAKLASMHPRILLEPFNDNKLYPHPICFFNNKLGKINVMYLKVTYSDLCFYF